MHETVLALARQMTGAAEQELPLLELLCTASEETWESRLRAGVSVEDCAGSFSCACAFSTAAKLLISRSAGGEFASYRAGEVSMGATTPAASAAAAEALRRQAEQMMAPYAVPDDFSLRGVQG